MALSHSMHRFLQFLAGQHAAAHSKDVKRYLKHIHKRTSELISLLRIHLKADPSDLDQMNLEQAAFQMFPVDIDRDDLIRQLIKLRTGVQSALKRLCKEGQPGRPDKGALDVMIRAWHAVYLQAGGLDPGCTRSRVSGTANGPLLKLLEEAFEKAFKGQKDRFPKDAIPKTSDTLAQRILLALKNHKPRNE